MSIRLKRLFDPYQVATSSGVKYTSPSSVRTRIDKLSFCNTSASSCWVSVWILPTGGSAADSTAVTDEKAIAPGQTWVDTNAIGLVMEPGDELHLKAQTATAVTAHASGTQVS